VRELEAMILGKYGYEVILAEDGRDAVKKFTELLNTVRNTLDRAEDLSR
jgi:hypothetical protein